MNQIEITYDQAVEETEKAIKQVDAAANQDWKKAAYDTIKELAAEGIEFTSFAVVTRLRDKDVHTHDLRAIGPMMLKAARAGVIVFTGDYLPNVSRHMTPSRVWRGTKKLA